MNTSNTHRWIRRKLKYSHHYQTKINSWMIPHTIFLTSLIKIWIHTSWSEQSLGPGPKAALAGPRDCSLHSVWINIFIQDVKVPVPPPPQFPQMAWNVSQNREMSLEIMWCAYFRISKKGVAILACHPHFIQSENRQMNFASERFKFSLFVSR